MPPIEIDKILSDPLMIVAAVLLVVSPVLFLVALVKYLRAPKAAHPDFGQPHHDFHSPLPSRTEPADEEPQSPASLALHPDEMPARGAAAPAPEAPAMPAAATETSPGLEAVAPPPSEAPPAPTPPPALRRADTASEKTIVMPPGMAEMQGEMEIAFSQLKTLNKRVYDLEGHIRSLEKELSRLRAEKGDAGGGEGRPPMPV